MANTDPIILSFQTEGLTNSQTQLKETAQGVVNLTNAISSMQTEMAGLDKESARYKTLQKEVQATTNVFNTLSETQESLGSEYRKLVKDIGAIERALQGLKNEGQQDTEVFRNLTAQSKEFTASAANIKNKIEDINKGLKTLSSNTRVLDFMVQGTQAFTGAMQIAQGASALFGSENKKLEETLIKLNATMALANGLEQVSNLLKKDGAIVTGIMTTAQAAWNFVVAESTIALSAMRAALLATGIGAAIALVYGLYEAFKDLVGGTEDATEALKKQKKEEEAYKKSIDDTNEALKQRQEINDYVLKRDITLAKAKGASLEELRKIEDEYWSEKRFQSQERYENARNAVSSLLQAGYKKESAIVKAALKEQTDAEQAYYKTNQQFQLLKADRLVENKKIADEEVQTEKQKNAKLAAERKKDLEDAEKTYDAITKKQSDVARNVREEREKDKKQKEKDDEKELERLARIAREEEEFGKEKDKKEDEKTQKQIDREKNIATAKMVAMTAVKELSEFYFQQEQEATQQELNDRISALDQAREAELANKNLTEEQKAQIDAKYKALEYAARIKAFNDDKRTKIQQAIINGALAVTNAIATAPTILAGLALAAGVAITTSLQIATIQRTQPPKFKDGGSVAKRLGYIEGKPHSAGGELIEVEGNEFVMKGKAVNKYGVDFLDSINNLQMETMPRSSSNKPIIDYDKLGEVIGRNISQKSPVSVSIDKRGVNVYHGTNKILNNYINL